MNKSEFIDKLAVRFEGNRKAAGHALDAVVDLITRELARGEKVAITGFGAWEKAVRPARTVRNPRTGERIRAKRTSVPKFRAGANLKDVVSGERKPPKAAVAATSTKRAASSATTAKRTAKKATGAKKTTGRKSTAKKATSAAKKSTTKRAPAKKSATKKTSAAKKSTTKRAPAKKSTAKKSTAKRATKRS